MEEFVLQLVSHFMTAQQLFHLTLFLVIFLRRGISSVLVSEVPLCSNVLMMELYFTTPGTPGSIKQKIPFIVQTFQNIV